MNSFSSHWSVASISGHEADIFEPSQPHEGRAVVFLHGHAGTTLRDNAAWSTELERRGLRCVCPRGGRSWWTPQLCEEFSTDQTPLDFLAQDLLQWLAAEWQVEPPAVAVTGVSMGGQGALQLCYRHARLFPVVAAVSPIIDFHRLVGRGLPLDQMFEDEEAARQETVILHLHPMNWPRHQLLLCDPADQDWFAGVDRLAGKMSSSGIPFESDFETSAGGHSWQYFNAVAAAVVEFLADALQKEEFRIA
ncbi:MAG: alpha/beta fold hydrolase [Planctomycetaceae bacterium]